MATNDQLKALVKSHADGDDAQFYAVAMQVAAKAARAGQSNFAQDLRDLVDDLRKRTTAPSRVAAVVPVTQPRGELGSLLTVSYPDARLGDLVLSDELGARLNHVLLEQRQRDTLARHGLRPARRLLLIGPPGTGKTSTARVLAGELGLPLFAIRLDTIITKFMGETAAKLRLIFDALVETRGVYLFDEVDALAGDEDVPLAANATALAEDLKSHGMDIAANHFDQAFQSLTAERWEAANGQLRATYEDVLIEVARTKFGWTGNSGGQALDVLHGKKALNGHEHDYLKGLWGMSHTNGSHPGMSNQTEAQIRMQSIVAAVRFILNGVV